jgi:hypothetical protein
MFFYTKSILSYVYNQDLYSRTNDVLPKKLHKVNAFYLIDANKTAHGSVQPVTLRASVARIIHLWRRRQYGYHKHTMALPPQIWIIRRVRVWFLLLLYLAQEIRARNAGGWASWRGRVGTAHPESMSTKITGRTNTNTLPNRTFIQQLQITRTSVWHMISARKTVRYTGHSLTARNNWHFRSV